MERGDRLLVAGRHVARRVIVGVVEGAGGVAVGFAAAAGRNHVLSAGGDDARAALPTHLADVQQHQRRAVSAGSEGGVGEPQAVGGPGEALRPVQLPGGDGLAGLADQFDGALLGGRRWGPAPTRRHSPGAEDAAAYPGAEGAAASRVPRDRSRGRRVPRRAAAIRSSNSCGFCSNGPYTMRMLAARPANRSASSNSPQRARPSAWSIMLRAYMRA